VTHLAVREDTGQDDGVFMSDVAEEVSNPDGSQNQPISHLPIPTDTQYEFEERNQNKAEMQIVHEE